MATAAESKKITRPQRVAHLENLLNKIGVDDSRKVVLQNLLSDLRQRRSPEWLAARLLARIGAASDTTHQALYRAALDQLKHEQLIDVPVQSDDANPDA